MTMKQYAGRFGVINFEARQPLSVAVTQPKFVVGRRYRMRSAVKAYNWTCTATTTDVTVFNGWLIRGEDGRLTAGIDGITDILPE